MSFFVGHSKKQDKKITYQEKNHDMPTDEPGTSGEFLAFSQLV